MQLLTLDEAGERVRRTPRALRALIHSGKLPASKIGRSYLVSADDLDALFRPTRHPSTPDVRRESPRARERRQLAEAGITTAALSSLPEAR